ncbi:MAG: hypothetical protein ACD_63C00245G0001 [uncultured bacterium]|nr:MAG: hypothetical protein ACD_63C00245G0001 [uncultured bacterium]
MKIIIFSGGVGTRLWPLSRKKSPKQFEKIFGGKSTLELALERVKPIFDWEDIFVQTSVDYSGIVRRQLPNLLKQNLFLEPARRDLAAAVGFAMIRLKKFGNEPIAISWSDHLMKRPSSFRRALQVGEKLILKNPDRFVYFGEKPVFPNYNLGWIRFGRKLDRLKDVDVAAFKEWRYRPSVETCEKMFASGKWLINSGYWVTSPEFVLKKYQEKAPSIFKKLLKIEKVIGTKKEKEVVKKVYSSIKKINFDKAILEKLVSGSSVVLKLDMGWSDPGTLYTLKEALQKSKKANVIEGNVVTYKTKDSLVYNCDKHKLVSTVGLDGMMVVVTDDVVLVVHKENMNEVGKLVEKLSKKAKYEKYT